MSTKLAETSLLDIDERAVYNYITRFIKSKHYPPTIREIADKTAISGTTVSRVIGRLQSKGLLQHDAKKARAITLTNFDFVRK